jgi:hypothetical protein
MSEIKVTCSPDVDGVFTQLDAALCLLARAKGESPAKQYFTATTPNVRRLRLDGAVFQIVLTHVEEDDK